MFGPTQGCQCKAPLAGLAGPGLAGLAGPGRAGLAGPGLAGLESTASQATKTSRR